VVQQRWDDDRDRCWEGGEGGDGIFRSQGWDIINMTQYPEVILARELELCYVNISLVTDYDVGLEGDPKVKPVSNLEVMRVFNANLKRLRSLLLKAIELTPSKRSCPWPHGGCSRCALEGNGPHRPRIAGEPGATWSGSTSIACIHRWRRWA